MKNTYKIILILVLIGAFLIPSYSVKAGPFDIVANSEDFQKKVEEVEKSIKEAKEAEQNKTDEEKQKERSSDCRYVFGDPNDESSVAYIMQKIINYVKVLAPLLVLLLSGFEFAKNILTGDYDDMQKVLKKFGIRIACAVGVYLAPLLTGFIINFINNSSVDQTCNIK